MNFIGNHFFLQFWVPLVTVALTIFVKFVSRRDTHRSFVKEDLAVGLDLSAVALFLFLTSGSQLARQLAANPKDEHLIGKTMAMPWILLAYVIGLWAVSTLIRKAGWESDGKLKAFFGIIVPDFFGVSCLLFAVNWIP